MTLFEAITRHGGKAAPCLIKHLNASGITDWNDLTRTNLHELRDELKRTVAPNSAKTYLAELRSILHRYSDDIELPKGWEDIFKAKAEKPVKTYLTTEEIARFEAVTPRNKREEYVQAAFLCGCWTGARISDIVGFTEENIADGVLTYVSHKTGIQASVPAKPGLWEKIQVVQNYPEEMCLMTYNRIVRSLARKAGISEKVKIYKAGVTKVVEKYAALSSHDARRSFCTNLAAAGCSINDVARLAGHQNPITTMGYICNYKVNLPKMAMAYFS